MSTVLSIYSVKAFKEYLLPAINNEEYSIILNRDIFRLGRDVKLDLENVEQHWFFRKSNEYRIAEVSSGQEFCDQRLKNDDLLRITLADGEILSVMVEETENTFAVFDKYNIQNCDTVTIGKAESNDIRYSRLKLISREHAVIRNSGKQCVVEDRSANGVFVNSERIAGSRALSFGDHIDIFGLELVYLDGILAVNTHKDTISLKENVLKKYVSPPVNIGREKRSGKAERILYHRSPRQIYKISDEEIEIEGPPQPQPLNRKPIGLLIGPSMTMALPMLLGCGLAVYSTKLSGGTSSAFMYTGIVTAIASAIIGTVWSLVNLRFEQKKYREGELHRFEAYSEYLIKCANSIKEKYEKNTENMRAMYISAQECSRYNERNPLLWNRNMDHYDFLSHRLGMGDAPFQIRITVPKERFTLINDSLSEKPKLIRESYKMLHQVPICIDLLEHRIVGIVGGDKKQGAVDIMHNLVAQIAVSNCYTDVKLAFIYDEGDDENNSWGYLKWFPHTWSEDKKTRFIAKNKVEAGDVLYEITKALRIRAEQSGGDRGKKLERPQYILFVASPELLEGELITKYIYEEEQNYGLTTIFLVDNYEKLPNACDYIIQNDSSFQGMYAITDDMEERIRVDFDRLSDLQLENLARNLADIEVNESETGGDIPSSLTFFDMYKVGTLQELNVLDRWRKNRTYDSMRALIGEKAGGAPWYLDIHEKYHGPHGLIAGTTGSGKSETLQTYILSLALNFSPNDVGFFIIDYKGGGMANLFDGLPHMIGQISNLSGNQVKRAMVSIKSENKRRQRIFNEYGVNNINLYTRLYKNKEAALPIPHMFIIIDEFAELKREEPDFMRELISVAQVGRSLGVHLILATQKPSGTVDDNIWSNSKFRLCLRVQDRQDSNDMLHRPDAAYITQAGRCYMQVGNDELFELFQSGWSGAIYDENSNQQKSDIAHMISSTGKAALIGNRMKIKQKEHNKKLWIAQLLKLLNGMQIKSSDEEISDETVKQIFAMLADNGVDYPYSDYNSQRVRDLLKAKAAVEEAGVSFEMPDGEKMAEGVMKYAEERSLKLPEKKEKTQLDAVVSYLNQVAKESGYNYDLKLWLPVLPVCLYLNQLEGYQEGFDGEKWNFEMNSWNIEVPVGLYDDPVNQEQKPIYINLSRNGHHAVVGTVVSGKSTFLQTFVYALLTKYTPKEINIYAIDFSAKMLSAFENMPHVGGVIYENEDDRLAKFFNMISGILEERKILFKGGNYSQYVRVNGVVLPSILLVIDNYANFKTKTNNRYEDMILQLSKDGMAYGIFLFITAGGFSAMEIPSRIGDNLRTVISLEMSDKYQYAEVMRTTHIETLPEVNIKGRGIARVGDEILEFQTALAFEADDDFKRMEKLQAIGAQMRAAWKGKTARSIPEIPDKPIWTEFSEMDEVKSMLADDRHLPIGYNFDNASVFGINLSRTFCYLITGKDRSGKTNLLKLLMHSASLKGGKITVFDFGGEFTAWRERVEFEHIDTDQKMFDFFKELLEDFRERNAQKKKDVKLGMSDEEIYMDMRQFPARYLLIANCADFIQHVTRPDEGVGDMKAFVENLLDKGSFHNVFLFVVHKQDETVKVAGTRLFELLTRAKAGAHFGGNVAAQRIMNFDYVSYQEQNKPQKPGIAMLPANDEENVRKVVVPLLKG
jgi:S-DNA-T family DNA segregation ATPase FtsK/SpoIIIE